MKRITKKQLKQGSIDFIMATLLSGYNGDKIKKSAPAERGLSRFTQAELDSLESLIIEYRNNN